MAKRSNAAVLDEPVADEATGTDEVQAQDEAVNGEAEGSEDEVIDLSDLNSALDAVLAGDVSDPGAVDFAGVVSAYGNLTRKGKAAATRELNDKSRTLLESGDFDAARVVLLASKATKATATKGTGPGRKRKAVDPTEALVEKLAGFQLAYNALINSLPEGIAENWQDQVTEMFNANIPEVEKVRAWTFADKDSRGEIPDVSPVAVTAARLAFGGSRAPYRGRHDVGAHIAQVFANVPAGTFMTDAEIAKQKSEEYGDETCTRTAVSARLNSDKPLAEGLTVTTQAGKLGVVKG